MGTPSLGPPHLHLHLEPSRRLDRRKTSPAPAGATGADAFFGPMGRVAAPDTTDLALLPELVRDVAAEQRRQGIGLVELRFSPRRWLRGDTSMSRVLDAASGAAKACGHPHLRLVLTLHRANPPHLFTAASELVEEGLPAAFVAVDLAGDDRSWSDDHRFAPVARAAHAAGLLVTVHASEFAGPAAAWTALDVYGAVRIGHAVRAIEDDRLVARLAAEGVLVETSLTSNVATGAVPRSSRHPARVLLDAGVPVCFNQDVPVFTGSSMTDELSLATSWLSLSPGDVSELQDRARRWSSAHRGDRS